MRWLANQDPLTSRCDDMTPSRGFLYVKRSRCLPFCCVGCVPVLHLSNCNYVLTKFLHSGTLLGEKVLAYKYLNNPAQALIANANLGGDSCHRGSLLGSILGAAGGAPIGTQAHRVLHNLQGQLSVTSRTLVRGFAKLSNQLQGSHLDDLVEGRIAERAGGSFGMAFAAESDACAT